MANKNGAEFVSVFVFVFGSFTSTRAREIIERETEGSGSGFVVIGQEGNSVPMDTWEFFISSFMSGLPLLLFAE